MPKQTGPLEMELQTNDDVVQGTGFILPPISTAYLAHKETQDLSQMCLVHAQGVIDIAKHNLMRTGQHLQTVLSPRIKQTNSPLNLPLSVLRKSFALSFWMTSLEVGGLNLDVKSMSPPPAEDLGESS